MTVTRRSGHHAGASTAGGGAGSPAVSAAAAAPSSSASQPQQEQQATAVLPTPPAVATASRKGSNSNSKQASARRQSAAAAAAASPMAVDGPATLAHPLAPNPQQGAPAATASQSTSSSGAVTIEDAAVDALVEQPFPRKSHAKALQPKDQQDELLMFCARAVACCGNRALTPKEIAAIGA